MDSILAGLNSDDEAIRREAIDAAPDMADEEVVDRLVGLVRDSDVGRRSREAAARSLGRCRDERASGVLLALLRDEEPVLRELAATGLSEVHTGESVHALIGALTDPTNTVRNTAERSLLTMSQTMHEHGFDRLLELLAHENSLSRSPAARLLGQTEDERALEPLVKMLREDPEWLGRMWAARGLGDLGHQAGFEALAKTLRNDEKNRVRAAAAEALGKIRHTGSRDALEAAKDDEDGGVRKVAEEALAALHQAGFEDENDPFAD